MRRGCRGRQGERGGQRLGGVLRNGEGAIAMKSEGKYKGAVKEVRLYRVSSGEPKTGLPGEEVSRWQWAICLEVKAGVRD